MVICLLAGIVHADALLSDCMVGREGDVLGCGLLGLQIRKSSESGLHI